MPKPVSNPSHRLDLHATLSLQDRPLVDDIRWLGRILGDVIREQEGDAAFALARN
jgi:phosphoenolpyruvate carboxylase